MSTNELEYDQLFNREISDFLKTNRDASGYSTALVSSFMSLNTLTYLRYENNERSIPLSVLKKACSLYHLNYYRVFEQIDKKISRLNFNYVLMPINHFEEDKVEELFKRVEKIERLVYNYEFKK